MILLSDATACCPAAHSKRSATFPSQSEAERTSISSAIDRNGSSSSFEEQRLGVLGDGTARSSRTCVVAIRPLLASHHARVPSCEREEHRARLISSIAAWTRQLPHSLEPTRAKLTSRRTPQPLPALLLPSSQRLRAPLAGCPPAADERRRWRPCWSG